MYGPFDKQLELAEIGAVTSTAAKTGVAFPVRMAGEFKCIFVVTAIDVSSGNETYKLSVETDSVAAFNDAPAEVGAVPIFATGIYEVPLSQWQIDKADGDAAAIRVKATLTGTTPSITYGAFLAPTV